MNFCKWVSISLYIMKSSKNIFMKLFRYFLNVFLPTLWNVGNPFFTLKGRVVKTNVAWSLCIKHHIGVHHYALIASIRIDAWKNIITLGLPPLCMVIENGFSCHKIHDQIFNFHVIEIFWSPTFGHHNQQPKLFGH